jgi:hypothetical protein
VLVSQHGQATTAEAGLAVAATLVAFTPETAVMSADLAAIGWEDSVATTSEASGRRQLLPVAVFGQPHVSREAARLWPIDITPDQVADHNSITVRLPDLLCGWMERQAWATARHGLPWEGPGQLGGSKIALEH